MDDPANYEYAPVKRPGGLWHLVPAADVQATDQFDEHADNPHIIHPLAIPSDNVIEDLMDQDQLTWTRSG